MGDGAVSCPQTVHCLRGGAQKDPHSWLFSLQEPGKSFGKVGESMGTVPPNHQQRLEHIIKRAAVEDKVRGLQFAPHSLPAHSWLLETPCPCWYLCLFGIVSFNRRAQHHVSHNCIIAEVTASG